MSRWVTFYYDNLRDVVSNLRIHNNKNDALKYFNEHCKDFFVINSSFKAEDLPARYGHITRAFHGISVTSFKRQFGISVDDAMKEMERE